ncbi:MAG: hypothetical protein AMXMBFR77_19860 [Phycisphaerales bacterium]|nr:MAG: hypothetical protein BroJett004_18160 [Planctomycetota bacterium]
MDSTGRTLGPAQESGVARETCYYDGGCGVCRRTSRWLRRLDWLRRLEFVDMTQVGPTELPVPADVALGGMPMRTSDGRVLVGFPAVRRALMLTPLGLIPGVLLHVPGVSWVGGRMYARIASRRRREESCGVSVQCADGD